MWETQLKMMTVRPVSYTHLLSKQWLMYTHTTTDVTYFLSEEQGHSQHLSTFIITAHSNDQNVINNRLHILFVSGLQHFIFLIKMK